MNTLDKFKEVSLLMKIYLKLTSIHSWKTNLMGCISAVATYLATVDYTQPAALKTAIVPITMIIWGVVQKDGNVSGTGSAGDPHTNDQSTN